MPSPLVSSYQWSSLLPSLLGKPPAGFCGIPQKTLCYSSVRPNQRLRPRSHSEHGYDLPNHNIHMIPRRRGSLGTITPALADRAGLASSYRLPAYPQTPWDSPLPYAGTDENSCDDWGRLIVRRSAACRTLDKSGCLNAGSLGMNGVRSFLRSQTSHVLTMSISAG